MNKLDLTRREFVNLSLTCTAAVGGMALVGCTPMQSGSTSANEFTDTEIKQTPAPVPPSPEELLNQRIDGIVNNMSLEHKAGQLLVVRPEVLQSGSGTTYADAQTLAALQSYPVGGLIYFGTNLISSKQTQDMLASTLEYGLQVNGIPPFLCVDEEGGTVSRIGGQSDYGVANAGNMADIGATGDVSQAKAAALYIASYLKPLGFNVDFAPVADVADEYKTSVMAERSFSSDPQVAAEMVTAQLEGFADSGMLCSVKHFPGIGEAEGDSHYGTIYSHLTKEEMLASILVPFKAAVDASAPMIMVSHMSVPELTGSDIPASLSPKIVSDLLRTELGYQGIIVTDSLGMGAINSYYSGAESVVMAIQAGVDIALMPPNIDPAFNAIVDAVSAGTLSEERVNESVRRIIRAKLSTMESLFRV